MSTKHNALSEADMKHFRMNSALLEQVHTLARGCAPESTRILDWGCGRGRSVALLRQEGFAAYGVDIDRDVMENGHDLFRTRGLDPTRLLWHIEEISNFEGGTFDTVFSEETLEHVADLAVVARETYRLLRPGGIAVHSFPGSRWLMEPHVHMPLVHWFPRGALRRLMIRFCLHLGLGPRPPWPEVGEDLKQKLDAYDRYLSEKTCYRSRKQIMAIFIDAGFACNWLDAEPVSVWHRLLPATLRENGFPTSHLLLELVKPE